MENRGTFWSLDETRALLAIWGQEEIQVCLEKMYRNTEIYDVIVNKMLKLGFDRNSKQCRTKIKQLKAEYRRSRDGTGVGRNVIKSCRFYKELDDILNKYPTKRPKKLTLEEQEAEDSDQEQSVYSDENDGECDATSTGIPTPTSKIIVNTSNKQSQNELNSFNIPTQNGGSNKLSITYTTPPSVKPVSPQPQHMEKSPVLNKRKRSWSNVISSSSEHEEVTRLQIENLHAEKEKFQIEREMLTLKREKLMMEKKLVEYKIKKIKIEMLEKGLKIDLD